MKQKIPLEVKKLYQKSGLGKRIYAYLRWRLCPFEEMEKHLPDSGIILDIGCGYGLLSNFLAFKSDKRLVIGIDNSLKRLKTARLTLGDRRNIKFIHGDVNGLELAGCRGAAMSDVLHHLSEQTSIELLKEIFNKLEPSGRLVIEEVGDRPFWKYLSNFVIDHILYPGQKISFKSVRHWQKLLEEIGFRVKVIPAHYGMPLSDVIFVCSK